MKKTGLLFLSILLFNFISAQEITLKIVETTDVHGKLIPGLNNDKEEYSLANVHSYVKQLKESGEQVILLDNGDILQGDPSVYYYNFINDTIEHLCARVLNYMKYDAASVGNHDIEAGHPVYDRLVNEYNFPWLAANAVHEDSKEPYFKPYTIIEKEGVKVAILGMITPGIPKWLPEKIWEGIIFEDMIETAKKWIPIVKQENPDLVVGLFHSGVDYTYDHQDENSKYNENAVKLVAQQVDGFDIIFAGHDHKEWDFTVNSPNGNTVHILGGASYARVVAQANVVLENNGGEIRLKSIDGEIVQMKDYEADEEFVAEFSSDQILIHEFINRELGIFDKKIVANKSLFSDSEFMDLIHNAQLNISNADISFAAPLSYRSVIDSGKVTVHDMFKLYRFENLLYTMQLSGEEIDKYLEYSYDLWMNEMNDAGDNLLSFKKDSTQNIVNNKYGNPILANQYYNFDSAEGIIYKVDLSKKKGNRVEIISFTNGEQFDLNKEYKVAINSYRGNGGGGHLTKGVGIDKEQLADRVITSTEKDLRYYMIQWITEKEVVSPVCNNNWEVLPKTWFDEAYKRDFNLLFDE